MKRIYNYNIFLVALLLGPIVLIIFFNKFNFYIFPLIIASFISSFFIIYPKEIPYSLNKIYNIFNYLLMCIVPILTFSHEKTFWLPGYIDDHDYFEPSIVVMISTLLINFFYKISNITNRESIQFNGYENKEYSYFFILISTIVCFYIAFLNNFSFTNIWSLQKDSTFITVSSGKSFFLFNSYFITPLLSGSIFFNKLLNKKSLITEIYLFLLLLLFSPPTSISRYAVAVMYFPILFLYLKYLNKGVSFIFIFFISIFIVFPLLEPFRDGIQTYDNFSDYFNKVNFLSIFTDGHFDTFQSLLLALKYEFYSNEIVKPLFSVLFFFVPRSFWIDKFVGSGEILSNKLILSFNNLSFNIFAEAYFNFGYFGIFVFILFILFFITILDKIFYNYSFCNSSPFFAFFYLQSMFLFFLILRGDLLSSFAYFISFTLSSLFIYSFFKFTKVILIR